MRALQGVEMLVEDLAPHPEDHAREHRDEAAVAVPREALVARARRQPVDGAVVQPEIEDRLHHAGHGDPRAGAHGDQQRAGGIPEAGVGHLLQALEMLQDLVPEPIRPGPSAALAMDPGLGGDGEARRHGDAEIRHLGELAALAAQKVAHHRGALGTPGPEEVDVLGHVRRRSTVGEREESTATSTKSFFASRRKRASLAARRARALATGRRNCRRRS